MKLIPFFKGKNISLKFYFIAFGVLATFIVGLIFLFGFRSVTESLLANNAKKNLKLQAESMTQILEKERSEISNTWNIAYSNDKIYYDIYTISQYQDRELLSEDITGLKKELANELFYVAQLTDTDRIYTLDSDFRNSVFYVKNYKTNDITHGYFKQNGNKEYKIIKKNMMGAKSTPFIKRNYSAFKNKKKRSVFLNQYDNKGLYMTAVFPVKNDSGSVYAYVVIERAIDKNILKNNEALSLETTLVYDNNVIFGSLEKKAGTVDINSDFKFLGLSGQKYFGMHTFNLDSDNKLKFIMAIDNKIFYDLKVLYYKYSLSIFIILSLVAILLSLLFFKKTVLTPLKALENFTKNIKSQNFRQLDAVYSTEFNHVIESYNEMSHIISERESSLKQTINELKEFQKAVDEGTIITKGDIYGNITYVNDKFCELTGYSKEDVLGEPHSIFRHPSIPKNIFKDMWNKIQNGEVWNGLLKNIDKTGNTIYIDLTIVPLRNIKGEIAEYISFRVDVTELVASKEKIKRLFIYDSLTQLGNRTKLIDDISDSEEIAVAILDINRFNQLNDAFGYEVGDKVIINIAEKMRAFFNFQEVLLYRLHADEFAVLYTGHIIKSDFTELVKNFLKIVESTPMNIDNFNINVELSSGISLAKEDTLVKADIALKTAKYNKEDYVVYSENLQTIEVYKENIAWATKLKDAINYDRIIPFLHPIINNTNGTVAKYEALIRLIDADGTVVSPGKFLDIAKNTKYYPKLTRIMVEKIFELVEAKPNNYSINISFDDIIDSVTSSFIIENLEKSNYSDKIIFEFTESEGIENSERVELFINEIKSYGAKLAIDDFGSGYSNFNYLIKLKADFIKIDGSLIKNLNNSNNYYLVKSITEFARLNNMEVVAEFVSGEEIYKSVVELGIGFSQGFYFGKPFSYIDL